MRAGPPQGFHIKLNSFLHQGRVHYFPNQFAMALLSYGFFPLFKGYASDLDCC